MLLFKVLILVILLYFAVRAVSNLMQATLEDPRGRRSQPLDRSHQRRPDRRPTDHSPWPEEEIEDAKWEDL